MHSKTPGRPSHPAWPTVDALRIPVLGKLGAHNKGMGEAPGQREQWHVDVLQLVPPKKRIVGALAEPSVASRGEKGFNGMRQMGIPYQPIEEKLDARMRHGQIQDAGRLVAMGRTRPQLCEAGGGRQL